MAGLLYGIQQRPEGGKGVPVMDPDGIRQCFPIIVRKSTDPIVQVGIEITLDLLTITHRTYPGKIPLENQVSVMPGGGIAADGKSPEELLEPVRPVEVVVVLQHGQQQTLAEPPRAQEKQLLASVFQQRNLIRAVHIIVFLGTYIHS